jgi:LPS export ABC transporter protein LptC/lipopolysaccharide transport protein LptA
MRGWKRWLRLALVAFVLVLAAIVYLTMRTQPPPRKRPPAKAAVDPRAVTEVSGGGEYKQYKLDKLDFTLRYERVLDYAEGNRKVQGVHAIVKGRDGKDVVIDSNEAAVGPNQSSFVATGNVKVRSADGLEFRTNEASYSQGEGIVRAPGPAEFSKGNTHGSSVGMTYDQHQEIITLLDQARLSTQDAADKPPATVESTSAVWTRPDRIIRFEGGAKIARSGQTLTGDTAVLYLTEDEQRVQRLELRGNARIVPDPAAGPAGGNSGQPRRSAPPSEGAEAGSLRAMRANTINLTYAEDGQTLQQALLAGNSLVEVQSSGAPGATRIVGEFVDMGLEADGTSLRSLLARGANANDRAELQLPPQADTPARIIRGATIQGPAPGAPRQAGAGMSSLRFTDAVEYRELPAPAKPGAPPPAARVAYARLLDLAMQPGLGSVDEARFSGNVRFTEGDSLQASSRDARYVMKTGQLDLSGAGADGQMPKVIDGQTTIQAASIQLTPDGRKVIAERTVQAEFKHDPKADAPASSHTPGILSGDQPVLATADRLDYDGSTSKAVFTSKGKSRLWQPSGGTTIHGSEITLDDTTGNLWAKGSVVSTMVLEQVDTKTNKREKVTSEGWADQLFYEDATRRATYTSNARIRGAEGDLKSDKAVVFLAKEENTMERLEATGHVEMQTPGPEGTGMRTANGDRLVYTASNEQYVMTAAKVAKYRDECSETEGKSLTFYRSAGTITVDGNQQRRTEMRTAQGCKQK